MTEKGKIILKNAIIKQSEIANNINALFQEFARTVLNVESATASIPVMPNPFASFLEEEGIKKSVAELEQQRKQLKQHIRLMQEKLTQVDNAIRENKKQSQKKL